MEINPAARRLFGFSREQMLAMEPRDLFAPASADVVERFVSAVSAGEPLSADARGVRGDGSRFDLEVAGAAVALGAHRYWLGSFCTLDARRPFRCEADFLALIARFSSELLKTDPEKMDAAVGADLARIGEVYDLDVCEFWWFEGHEQWVRSHLWASEALVEEAWAQDPVVPAGALGPLGARVADGLAVRIETPGDVPPGAADSWADGPGGSEPGGSQLILPLSVDGRVVCCFSAETVLRFRRWSDRVVEELQTLGEVIASSCARVRALRALRDSERRYRGIVEDQTEFVMRCKPDGTRTFVNEAYCRAVQGSREELIGTSFFPLLSPKTREGIREQLPQIRPDDPLRTDEHSLYLADGSKVWHQWTARGIFDDTGRLVEVQGVGRDVTERRRSEEELRHRVEYQSLLAEVASTLLQADPGSIDALIDAALARICAAYRLDFAGFWWLERDEQVVRTHFWTTRPEPRDSRLAVSREAAAWVEARVLRNEHVRFETQEELPPEALKLLETIGWRDITSALLLPIRIEGTTPGCFEAGTLLRSRRWSDRDTEELGTLGTVIASSYVRVGAVQGLRDSERRYRGIVEDQIDLIVRFTPDGARTFVNDAFCRVFGGTGDERVGADIYALIVPEDRGGVRAALAGLSPEDPVHTGECRMILPGGALSWWQWKNRGVFDAAGRLVEVQSVGRDVTERHRAERELRHRAEYQSLVADLSSQLLKADADAIDEPIESALARIGAAYDLDFCGFYWIDHERRWVRSHFWAPFVDAVQHGTIAVDEVPWATERMLVGEVVRLETLDDYPPQAAKERRAMERLGILSDFMLPIILDGTVVGSFTGGTFQRTRSWTDEVVAELQTLGEIVAEACARGRARATLAHREAELVRSQRMAQVGTYIFLPQEGAYTSSPELDAIHGLEPGDKRAYEEWVQRVHPDDRERVDSIVRGALTAESPEPGFAFEYRLIRADGAIRTLEDRSQIERDESGRAVRVFGTVLDVTERRQTEAQLSGALEELEVLKERLEVENVYLREEVRLARGSHSIVGESAALRRCLSLVERVAPTGAPVLIVGETGTGKELIARTLHDLSGRDGPLVSVNCAALPASLIESELFGYEKGAFTGAQSRKRGRLELADRGTLFLDEVGEIPLELQAKLLRVLQGADYERVGGVDSLRFTGRVVAATNRDLEEVVLRGEFRSDLYYRLNVFPLQVPPLRERREDIPSLAVHFAAKHGRAFGREVRSISSRMLDYLVARDWQGNVRELESFVQRALIIGDGRVLCLPELMAPAPGEARLESENGDRLQHVERSHILRVLEQTRGVVEGARGAAVRLGLAPSTLRSRMKKLGISLDR